MLDHQAKVDVQNNYGATPLHILAQHIMPDLITLMLDNGADRNALDKDLETPLTLAVKARNVENVDRLITEENINKPNIHLDTALHIACKNGFSEIVDLLILHNADIHVKNEDGNAPIHIATIYKHKECVEILIDNGADFLELNGRHKSAFALSTGEITTYLKKLLERSHKMNQNLKLRHADYVSIAKSKNQKASSRMSFRSNTSQNLNSRTQSKLSSRTTSKLSNRNQQTSNQKQEKPDDQMSVRSTKSSKTTASTTRKNTQKEARKTDENILYLDNIADSIRYIIDRAQDNFDQQMNEVKQEIDILISDLKKHEFVDQNYGTNDEVLEKTDQ